MSPLSRAVHDAILNQIFRSAAALGITGPFLVRLHTGNPQAATGLYDDQFEIDTGVWTNYADAEINEDGSTAPYFTAAADGSPPDHERFIQNNATVSFGTATMNPTSADVEVTHFSLHDQSSPEKFIGSEALDVAKTINHGDPVSFPANSLKVSLQPAT